MKVNIGDITYVEAMDNYIRIHRVNLPTVMTLMSMKDFMELLPANRFARIHRSYIVAIRQVESVGSKCVVMKGIGVNLPIGRTYWKNCPDLLGF